MNRKMLVLTAISDSQGTKLQKELKTMVREKYHQTVAPIDADTLVLDDIRAMARQLNEQNPKCKPVEITRNKFYGKHISWIGVRDDNGSNNCGLLNITPHTVLCIDDAVTNDGEVVSILKPAQEICITK